MFLPGAPSYTFSSTPQPFRSFHLPTPASNQSSFQLVALLNREEGLEIPRSRVQKDVTSQQSQSWGEVLKISKPTNCQSYPSGCKTPLPDGGNDSWSPSTVEFYDLRLLVLCQIQKDVVMSAFVCECLVGEGR